MAKIDTFRKRIAALKAEREQAERAPRALADVHGTIERQLSALADEGREALAWRLRRVAAGTESAAVLFGAPVREQRDGPSTAQAGPLLAALFGPAALMQALQPHLAALPAEGLTDADRRDILRRIDADLWAAELAEEAAIGEAEARGEAVQRRADANPAAVLYLPD